MQFIEPLIGFAGALVAALLGALATYMLGRRRASDRSVRSCGGLPLTGLLSRDRTSGTATSRVSGRPSNSRFKCLNAGILQNRKGTVLGTAKPKAQLENPVWRLLGEGVERKLNRIRLLIPPSGLPVDPKSVESMDRERKEIIEPLNHARKRTGLPLRPLPTEAGTIDDVFEE